MIFHSLIAPHGVSVFFLAILNKLVDLGDNFELIRGGVHLLAEYILHELIEVNEVDRGSLH